MTKKRARAKARWKVKKQIKKIGIPDSVALILATGVVKNLGMISSNPAHMLGMTGTGLFKDNYDHYPLLKQQAADCLAMAVLTPGGGDEPAIVCDGYLTSQDFDWIQDEFPILFDKPKKPEQVVDKGVIRVPRVHRLSYGGLQKGDEIVIKISEIVAVGPMHPSWSWNPEVLLNINVDSQRKEWYEKQRANGRVPGDECSAIYLRGVEETIWVYMSPAKLQSIVFGA